MGIDCLISIALLTPISYLGKSSGAGSVSLWTHHIKDIIFLPNYEFEGYSGKAFKVGAGVTLTEIYHAADAHGVTVLGGICPVSQIDKPQLWLKR